MKKRLLFMVTRPILGGAQKWVLSQIKLFSNDFDIYLSCANEGWLTEEVKPYIKEILVDSKLNKKFSFLYFLHLNKFLKANSIDLIIASSASAGIHSRLSGLITGTATIYVSHGWSAVYNGTYFTQPLFIKIEKFLAKYTSKILNISENDFEIALNTIGINFNKMLIIENAINPLGKRIKIEVDNKIKIVMVARFESPKRQDLLIEAVQSFSNIELYLVGDGPLLNEYKTKYKISNIFFLGANNNVYAILKKCHIFSLISDHEGLPLSVIEAMSIGMPQLLSNIDGCKNLIKESGVLVENSVDAIKEGITIIINKELNILSKNAYDIYQSRFNMDNTKDRYKALYNEC